MVADNKASSVVAKCSENGFHEKDGMEGLILSISMFIIYVT